MARDNEQRIKQVFEKGNIKPAVDQVQTLKQQTVGILKTIGAGFAVGAVVDRVKELFLIGAREQANVKALRETVNGLTGAYDRQKDSLEQLFSTIQRKTGVGDSQQRIILQQLIAQTDDYASSVRDLDLVINTARKFSRSYAEAARLVAFAHAGQIEQLGKVLPQMRTLAQRTREIEDPARRGAIALTALRDATDGYAESLSDDTLTQIDRFNASLGDLSEKTANALFNLEAAPALIQSLSDLLDSANQAEGGPGSRTLGALARFGGPQAIFNAWAEGAKKAADETRQLKDDLKELNDPSFIEGFGARFGGFAPTTFPLGGAAGGGGGPRTLPSALIMLKRNELEYRGKLAAALFNAEANHYTKVRGSMDIILAQVKEINLNNRESLGIWSDHVRLIAGSMQTSLEGAFHAARRGVDSLRDYMIDQLMNVAIRRISEALISSFLNLIPGSSFLNFFFNPGNIGPTAIGGGGGGGFPPDAMSNPAIRNSQFRALRYG